MSKAEELHKEILERLEKTVEATTDDPNRVMGGIIVAIGPRLEELVKMAEKNQGQQGVFNGGTFVNNNNGKDNPK